MCTYSEATPTTVWIWDIPRVSLVAVLTHVHPVRDTRWDPTSDRLALCTNTGRLYLWSLDGCVSVVVSCDHPPISVQRIQWHPSGQAIGLIGSNQFCVCFMNNNNNNNN
jgi:WD40 repeat protein